ncbi:MAG TPA: aminoacyl-tRNA hydrolase [Candidatus Poseidoniaceae archaeon]|nr:aminoacyl-tRNA hydrolase [Candidatus Poseidoniaceae archaeon]
MSREHDGPSMALIVRKELHLSSGKIAVQCAHAAVSCALMAKKNEVRIMERWQASGARKICLEVEDLASLKSIMTQAKSAGLITYLVKDAGQTEVAAGTITVLGIGPGPRNSIDALVSDLKPY